MSHNPIFLRKNRLDLDSDLQLSATQGNEFISSIRTKSNDLAWITTGSRDADGTTVEIDLLDPFEINIAILTSHNFKSYTLSYFEERTRAWVELVGLTDNASSTTWHMFQNVSASKWKLQIQSTQTPNDEKRLGRLILTDVLGQFTYSPVIKNPIHETGKIVKKMLSGKRSIRKTLGAFRCTLSIKHLRQEKDLALIEKLYNQFFGFEVWLCGGNEKQFFYPAKGYRLQDVYLMQAEDDWGPEMIEGIYANGYEFKMKLAEVTE